jgi:hypothetical protein
LLFPVRVELVFERYISWNVGFSRVWMSVYVTNRPIQLSWGNTCISPKETICVRRGVWRRLFPCVIWVRFCKEYFLQIIVFQVEKGSFCSKGLFRWVEETRVSRQSNHLC